MQWLKHFVAKIAAEVMRRDKNEERGVVVSTRRISRPDACKIQVHQTDPLEAMIRGRGVLPTIHSQCAFLRLVIRSDAQRGRDHAFLSFLPACHHSI
jgi:hypothetical protein